MADEYAKQNIPEKEKTELKTVADRLADGDGALSKPTPSPFAKAAEPSPFARPADQIHAETKATAEAEAKVAVEALAWLASPAQSGSAGDSPYANVYADTPYARLIEDVTNESSKNSSIANANSDSTNAPAELPDLGDKFKILGVIGEGGMGTVYRARDITLGHEVAIKVIRAELSKDQTALKRFYQESRALCQLNHSNIVAVYGLYQTEAGAPYLVMRYIEGESLGSAIKHMGRMDVTRALNIFTEICEALHYAHDRGVIHRDLKPSNILLTSQGMLSAQVVDFGIAKVASKGSGETVTGLTQMGDMFGTPTYMSPEQCEGDSLDARSDIYSLGCVMYETLCGEPPFVEANPFKLMTKHVNERPASLESRGIERTLSMIVAKCLEKRPEDRYQSADELMQDIVAMRTSKEPIYLRKKASSIKKIKFTPSGLLKAGLVVSGMVAIAGLTIVTSYAPSLNYSLALATKRSVIPSSSPIISMNDKPYFDRPELKVPVPFPSAPYVPIQAEPYSDDEKENFRKLLYSVTATRRETLEPFLSAGKRMVPFLLEEVKSPDATIARASSILLIKIGPSVLPGLIEDLRADSNRWIGDAIAGMGDTGVMAVASLLNDDDPQVRARAVNTIRGGIKDKPLSARLCNTLLWMAINDKDALVRQAASNLLAQASQNPMVNQVLSYNAINDPAVLVRDAAANSLSKVASREGDTSKDTLDVFGWILQKDPSDSVKTAVLQSTFMTDYGGPLAPYLRGAYYTSSTPIQRSILALSQHNNIGEALLPEMIDSLTKDGYDGMASLWNLKSMKGRAKPAIPALSAALVRLSIEHPSDSYKQKQLRDTIDELNKY
ncbi:MAG: protein kinase [Candidatus Melainabacteria bacterium]|nr:protein kinase [Candidatus Melainabacteria bacterium]